MREEEYSSKDLDHLGIVSAMCDEIDLVNTIDRLILPDPRAVLTTGECIKLMVMCLCLLVYTLAQRYLHQKLMELSTSVPNQLGKPTKRPTMRWIFQIFEGVHVLIHRTLDGTKEIILNVNPIRRHIFRAITHVKAWISFHRVFEACLRNLKHLNWKNAKQSTEYL